MNWLGTILYIILGAGTGYAINRYPFLGPVLAPVITVIAGHLPSPLVPAAPAAPVAKAE